MKANLKDIKQGDQRLRFLFGLMAAVLVATIGLSFVSGLAAYRKVVEVQEYDATIEQLQELLGSLQDAETGQRGYLLTRDTSYLEPYQDAMAIIQKRMGALESLSATGKLSRSDVQKISQLLSQKMEELEGTVQAGESGKFDAAINRVRSDEGKKVMDQIRKEVSDLKNQQLGLRSAAEIVSAHTLLTRNIVFIATAIINLAFLAWAYRRIGREMTRQYVAALETRRQKDVLAVTLASIGDAVIITDTAARITYLNPVAEELTGWKAHEAYEQPCATVFRILNEHTREPVESPVEKVLQSGVIVGLANHTLLIRKDGREVPIDDSGAPIREMDGTVRGVVLVFRDFSAHKESQHLLIRTKEDLEAASHVKDKFLATLSHELRTPLTPVLATLSAWEISGKLPSGFQGDLRIVRRNIELEARLIDDLLDLTRIQNGKLSLEKETIDAHEAIVNVSSLFRDESLEKKLGIALSLKARHSYVSADAGRLQQILWNIVGNAVKFTPHGGRITISSSETGAGLLEIVISDSGIGMSQETIGRLFQRFEQGSLPPEWKLRGLGLGLSIAKALAEAHGGELQASSPGVDLGSSFRLFLPQATSPEPSSQSDDAPIRNTPALRILLVEDHEDTAVVMQSVLTSVGHMVDLSSTVSSAVQRVIAKKYDLLLSDIGLPDGTGIDFIRQAREVTDTPAIALSGYGMAEDIDDALNAGFNEHITKPVDFEKLRRTIARVVSTRD